MTSKLKLCLLALISVSLICLSCAPAAEEQEKAGPMTDIPVSTSSDEALAAFKAGLLQIDLGNNPASRKHFHKAIELDPTFASAYVYRSWSSGSAEEFANDARAAMKHGESLTGPERNLIELEAAYLANDYEDQMTAINKMIEALPGAARPYSYLAFGFEGDDRAQKSRDAYQKAVELAPDWVGGYVGLGNSYMFDDPKDFAKAEQNMVKAVELAPEEGMAHIQLGDSYRAQQNLEKALISYQKATRLDSTDAMGYIKAGHVQTFLGRFADARIDYRKAGQLSENKMGSINFEAFTHLYKGDHEAALSFLNNRAQYLKESGVKESQMTGAKLSCINSCTWIAMHHDNVEHIKELMAMRQPLAVQAANDIGTAEAMANQNAFIQFWEGIAAAMEDNFEGALAKAEQNKATLNNNNNPDKLDNYHFLHAYINMRQENYPEAIKHFEAGDTDWIYNKYWLATALEKNGDTDKAMEIFNEIADWNFNNIGYALIRKEVKEKLES